MKLDQDQDIGDYPDPDQFSWYKELIWGSGWLKLEGIGTWCQIINDLTPGGHWMQPPGMSWTANREIPVAPGFPEIFDGDFCG